MSLELSELQRLFLWRIIADGGEAWLKYVKPALEAPKRAPLVQAGFVETERRRDPETKGVGLYVRVLDAGWDWASRNMDAALPTRSTAGSHVLQLILTRLGHFLTARDLNLATIFGDTSSQKLVGELTIPGVQPVEQPAVSRNLCDRISAACLKLGGGRDKVRVRLSDLRLALPDVARHDLDATLLQMSSDSKLNLYRLDNPAEIQPADCEAALTTASGEPRHIIYLG
jgi:hypothetical protein